MSEFSLAFPYAYGAPLLQADFRTFAEDFVVTENLGLMPSGSGEHVYLQITKRGENTDWVAQQIAKLANVKPIDVGLAGLKDRHAVTTQWFSVYLPKGPEPDWSELNTETLSLGTVARHQSKLRRGAHASNGFVITLRNLKYLSEAESHSGKTLETAFVAVQERVAEIAQKGVPNYFGEQRFGRGGGNLRLAERWFVDGEQIRKRSLRGLVMSAARSYLFNQVLAKRVIDDSWRTLMAGEPELEPTGPLWGRGRSLAKDAALAFETDVLAEFASWLDGLEHQGLSQERRGFVLLPQDLCLEGGLDKVTLSFTLQPGTYATVILRELFELNNVANVSTSAE